MIRQRLRMKRGMSRLVCLVALHLVATAGLLAFVMYVDANRDGPLSLFGFLGLLFGQAALVSRWAGLSGASIRNRCRGLFASGAAIWAVWLRQHAVTLGRGLPLDGPD
jgi:hypothetical protein